MNKVSVRKIITLTISFVLLPIFSFANEPYTQNNNNKLFVNDYSFSISKNLDGNFKDILDGNVSNELTLELEKNIRYYIKIKPKSGNSPLPNMTGLIKLNGYDDVYTIDDNISRLEFSLSGYENLNINLSFIENPSVNNHKTNIPKPVLRSPIKLTPGPTVNTPWDEKTSKGFRWKNGALMYYYSPGQYYANTMKTIAGFKYRFAKNGHIVLSQVFKYGNKWYFSYADGKINNRNRWITYKGNKYLARKDGTLYAGLYLSVSGGYQVCFRQNASMVKNQVVVCKGVYRYASSDGKLVRSSRWFNLRSGTYYSRSGGNFYKNQFATYKGNRYYFGSNAKLVKTPFYIKGIKITPNAKSGTIGSYEWNRYLKLTAAQNRGPYRYSEYVFISIANQRLDYYKNGKLLIRTSIVTGTQNQTPTPKGSYRLITKNRNIYLAGTNYRSFVSYWMPFIGSSYGMHDASWRSSFGGSIYRNSGSHGCVNMPRGAAANLYSRISIGCRVIIK